MTTPWWSVTHGEQLAQGDLLPECILPVFTGEPGIVEQEALRVARLIVVTQSCDLQNQKSEFVALCPVHTLPEFEVANSSFVKKGPGNQSAKGEWKACTSSRHPKRLLITGLPSLSILG